MSAREPLNALFLARYKDLKTLHVELTQLRKDVAAAKELQEHLFHKNPLLTVSSWPPEDQNAYRQAGSELLLKQRLFNALATEYNAAMAKNIFLFSRELRLPDESGVLVFDALPEKYSLY